VFAPAVGRKLGFVGREPLPAATFSQRGRVVVSKVQKTPPVPVRVLDCGV